MENIGGALGEGYGILGQAGSSKLCLSLEMTLQYGVKELLVYIFATFGNKKTILFFVSFCCIECVGFCFLLLFFVAHCFFLLHCVTLLLMFWYTVVLDFCYLF
ncbi:unnamed protein product [Cuscuta epithymum]|uniref:Uncharacterized protein n=1 Tax=Cuscuta epithymum TaxID=186058 RepID=A0AAV0DKN0_9ASTE|nr:unnamed protein product [Cuscuta epithymum]